MRRLTLACFSRLTSKRRRSCARKQARSQAAISVSPPTKQDCASHASLVRPREFVYGPAPLSEPRFWTLA